MSAGLEVIESFYEELERKRRSDGASPEALEELSKTARRALDLAKVLTARREAFVPDDDFDFLEHLRAQRTKAPVSTPRPRPPPTSCDIRRADGSLVKVTTVMTAAGETIAKPPCDVCGFSFGFPTIYCPDCGARR